MIKKNKQTNTNDSKTALPDREASFCITQTEKYTREPEKRGGEAILEPSQLGYDRANLPSD